MNAEAKRPIIVENKYIVRVSLYFRFVLDVKRSQSILKCHTMIGCISYCYFPTISSHYIRLNENNIFHKQLFFASVVLSTTRLCIEAWSVDKVYHHQNHHHRRRCRHCRRKSISLWMHRVPRGFSSTNGQKSVTINRKTGKMIKYTFIIVPPLYRNIELI